MELYALAKVLPLRSIIHTQSVLACILKVKQYISSSGNHLPFHGSYPVTIQKVATMLDIRTELTILYMACHSNLHNMILIFQEW